MLVQVIQTIGQPLVTWVCLEEVRRRLPLIRSAEQPVAGMNAAGGFGVHHAAAGRLAYAVVVVAAERPDMRRVPAAVCLERFHRAEPVDKSTAGASAQA
jgi:hypothetical protein